MAEFTLPKLSRRDYLIASSAGRPGDIQVPPTIIKGSTITFCGEAPGKDEVLSRQGFTGGSGNVLWRMAAEAGIDSKQVNRTNVAKRRPSSDNFGVFYHDPDRRTKPTEELIYWQQLLVAELSKTTPRLFIAVGDEALRAVLPSIRGISKWRGSILESEVIPGMKVLPIMHPAWIMRMNWEWYYIGIKDLKRAKLLSEGKALKEVDPHFIIKPSINQALEFIYEIYSHPNEEWCIDIETRGDTISCFGLSIDSILRDSAICIPIQTTTGTYWTEAEEASIWKALGDAFQANPKCLNQNLVYDIDYMLSDYRIEPSGFAFDPMIAHKLCYPEFDKGLDFTTSLYTYIPYYKDEGKSWKKKVPNEIEWTYNCKDVWATPKVAAAVKSELKQQGLLETYEKRAHRFIPIALEMQRNRLKINLEWKAKLANILEEERRKVHTELSQLTGISEENLNVKSSPQIQKVLYEDLRLPEKKKRGSQKLSTEEVILKELRAGLAVGSHPHQVICKIIEERHLRTRQSNYINITLDPDNHWPFTVFVNNDKTGRWESKSSPKWRGSKITHIPKVVRLMFEPPTGRIFVQRDLSQAEARYVGAESRCLFLNQTFKEFDQGTGPKIHQKVGKLCWGVEPKQDSPEYDTSKSIVHAYNYKESPKRLAIEAGLPFEVGAKVYSTYARSVPEVTAWHERIKDEATRTGRLTTPTGRIRQCFGACGMVANTGALGDEIWRDLVSWKPQTTIPDILNEGMWRTWDQLGDKVLFHQQGHDSHLDSIEPSFLEEYFTSTEVFHRVPILVDKTIELIIPSEMSWGYLWGALKPYKPGDKGTYEEWFEWATQAKYFVSEGKGGIKEKLYALF
jgi:uracil-DNA glycosylase family 4